MKGSGKRLTLAVALFGTLCTQVHGATQTCRQLETALAIALSRSGTSPEIRAYDTAIHRQNTEIEATRRRARDADCGFSLLSGNIRQCASLNATLQRMGTNLDTLHNKRDALARGGAKRSRSRILARIEARGCRKGSENTAHIVDNSKSPSTEALPGPIARDGAAPVLDIDSGHITVRPNAYGRSAGDFRTTCVRTCDGYFFPMSNAATVSDFQRDQANCESACPGTEMQVFYQRGMGGNSADMLSAATGRPYGELTSAYRYKRLDIERAPACGCNAARNFSVIGGASSLNTAKPLESSSRSPSILSVASPHGTESHPAEANIPQSTPEATERASGNHQIRVVGPRFFPDPKAAIDLQAPARTQDR